ncbi:jg20165 [Pararge aegeria aegeria]|uniref:Jg20165 protein n=1 Tax=Pararge aegeria aegeria TaxID=348720 RepID=A0A8S4S8F7_9NEOP|nr:jg20165 [Pararge aegeria aegeria]
MITYVTVLMLIACIQIADSFAIVRPLLNIGLFQAAPTFPIFGFPHPVTRRFLAPPAPPSSRPLPESEEVGPPGTRGLFFVVLLIRIMP